MRYYERYMTRLPEYEYPLRSLFTWGTPKMATKVNNEYRCETTLGRGLSLILGKRGKSVDDVWVILDVDGQLRDSKWDELNKPAPEGVVTFFGNDFVIKCRNGIFTYDQTESVVPKKESETSNNYKREHELLKSIRDGFFTYTADGDSLSRRIVKLLKKNGRLPSDILHYAVDGEYNWLTVKDWSEMDGWGMKHAKFYGVGFVIELANGDLMYRETPIIPAEVKSTTPDHYKGTHEPIEVMKEWLTDDQYMGFCLGNAIKYIARYDKKGTPVEDINKAIVYLEWAKLHMESQK